MKKCSHGCNTISDCSVRLLSFYLSIHPSTGCLALGKALIKTNGGIIYICQGTPPPFFFLLSSHTMFPSPLNASQMMKPYLVSCGEKKQKKQKTTKIPPTGGAFSIPIAKQNPVYRFCGKRLWVGLGWVGLGW